MRVTKILALLTASVLLCGCTGRGTAESSGGLFVGIEPAQESAEQAKYGDGTYVSQTVHDPVPDPYKSDSTLKKEGTTPEGIKYALYQKHAEITGHTAKFDAEELEIPEKLEGLPVTKIASVPEPEDSIFDIDKTGGFYSCYTLKKVTLPEGLTDIGDYAFYGCRNLKEIEIPETVARIGRRAFAMCGSLSKLTVPAAIDTIGDNAFSLTPWYDSLLYHRDLVIFNGRVYDAGRRCTGTVTVPDYVVAVADYAFYSCEGLTTVILPESVKSVGKYAFCDCPDLRSILFKNPECTIPALESTVSNKPTGSNKDFYRGIIYGEPKSTAEKFAKKMGFRFEDTEEFARRQEQEKIRQLLRGDDTEKEPAHTTAPAETDVTGTGTGTDGTDVTKTTATTAKVKETTKKSD